MGEVYLAHDARLERNVALKVLPEAVATDPAYRRRFETEARAASALSHPNAAHIYDVGEERGRHFIAMEYVEGETLRGLVGRGALSASRVVELGLQIASALEEAHGRGIVHRDIKPANVIVTKRGDAKVLDFGLARRDGGPDEIADSQMSTDLHTQVGAVLGTVPYMSPEQALGKEVDSRTDLFSLGVVLYEMATGKRPFSGSTTTQIIDAICHGEPEPLSAFEAAQPAELDRIISKCLAKDREQRYATARDLVVDLRNLHRMIESGSAPRVATVPGRDRRWWFAAAAVVALAGISFGVWGGVPSAEASIDSIAVLPFENVTGDPEIGYLSDGISESLLNSLTQLPVRGSQGDRRKARGASPRAGACHAARRPGRGQRRADRCGAGSAALGRSLRAIDERRVGDRARARHCDPGEAEDEALGQRSGQPGS